MVDLKKRTQPSSFGKNRVNSLNFFIPILFFTLQKLRSTRQNGFEVGIELAGERGQDNIPDPVAGEARVGVGGVLAPAEPVGPGPLPDFVAAEREQRAHKSFGRDRADGGEPRGTGASQEAMEDGFGLVAAGVAERDPVEAMGEKESATELAGFLLQVVLARRFEAGCQQRQSGRARQFG